MPFVDAEAACRDGATRAREGQYVEALERFDDALRISPECLRAVAGKARVLHLRGDSERALELLERALARRPRWGAGLAVKIDILVDRGDNTAAVRAIDDSLQGTGSLLPGQTRRHLEAAAAAAECGGPSREADEIHRAASLVKREPGDAQSWLKFAAALAKVGDVESAYRALATGVGRVALQQEKGHMRWVDTLSDTAYRGDCLIVAGDVADSMGYLRAALTKLKKKFRRVVFTPGNHDLWLRPGDGKPYSDSVHKLIDILDFCDELGVDTTTAQVARNLFVMPLFSWPNCEFDPHDPTEGRLRFDAYCTWPVPCGEVSALFRRMNEARLGEYCSMVAASGPPPLLVTASHFLPRRELPWSPWVAELAKNVGDLGIDAQLRRVGSRTHVFGHTHVNTDVELDGVRYVQHALEAAGGVRARPLCLVDPGQSPPDRAGGRG
ncbi:unnamed protein product [Pedinophyceae sp. YPF-701]|nr:unnamed protein product [Pedinophyceae sp. YPF-701]